MGEGYKDRPCDIGKANREVKDTALGPDESVQFFGPMVWHGLQECRNRGEERLHVECRVKRHHIRNQAGKSTFQMMKDEIH